MHNLLTSLSVRDFLIIIMKGKKHLPPWKSSISFIIIFNIFRCHVEFKKTHSVKLENM